MKVIVIFFLFLLLVLFLSVQIIEKLCGCYVGINGIGFNVLLYVEVWGVLFIEKWFVLELILGIFDFSELDVFIELVMDVGFFYVFVVLIGVFGYLEWLLSELGVVYYIFSYQG